MADLTIQTALPVAKLRSLEHYCPGSQDLWSMQRLGIILANKVEQYDSVISPREFKQQVEAALREFDPTDYGLMEKGTLVPMARLFILNVIIDSVLPPYFVNEVLSAYDYKRPARSS